MYSNTKTQTSRFNIKNDEQEVSCDASAGTFTLTFDGAETDSIDYDADEAGVISALEELSTISEVNVTFLAGVSQACQAFPSPLGFNVTFLEVADYRGDVPLMTSNIDNLEVCLHSNATQSAQCVCHVCVYYLPVSVFGSITIIYTCTNALCLAMSVSVCASVCQSASITTMYA